MDDLLDLFDRDRRTRNNTRGSARGLRGLLQRLTDMDDGDDDRRRRYHDDDDDAPRTHNRQRRRRDDDHDLFDI